MPADDLDRLLVAQIRRGEPGAWEECIARFEGRLQAFVESRLTAPNLSHQQPVEIICGHR